MAGESAEARLDSIRLSDAGAAEIENGRLVILVPRSEIVRLDIARGSSVKHPVAAAVIGATLILASVAYLVWIPRVLEHYSHGWKSAPFAGFAVIGFWMLQIAIRKRWILVVHTPSGPRKLAFHACRDRHTIDAFVREGRRQFGYG